LHRRGSWFTGFAPRGKPPVRRNDRELLLSVLNFKANRAARAGMTISVLAAAFAFAGCKSDVLSTSETLTQGYVIDQQQIDQVPVGSSREQVQLALGTPSTTATFDNEVFYYISQKRVRTVAFQNPKLVDQRVLAVYFGDDGRVSRVANYGMQDGKLFDFVSRTTPTGGRDHNFLSQLLAGVGKVPAGLLGGNTGMPGGGP
jgi:outer membrane protein assembly factor BamE (lipoprotein component of BamABCDE complex)